MPVIMHHNSCHTHPLTLMDKFEEELVKAAIEITSPRPADAAKITDMQLIIKSQQTPTPLRSLSVRLLSDAGYQVFGVGDLLDVNGCLIYVVNIYISSFPAHQTHLVF